MRALGVDPGTKGALAIVDDELGIIACLDMPTTVLEFMKNGRRTKRQIVDPEAVGAWLRDWASRDVAVAVIEDVTASPQMGCVSAFGFGRSKGVIEGAVAACRLPITLVTPANWKKAMMITADKETSLALARTMWPDDVDLFLRKKDADRAEACLLALHGLREMRAAA